MKCVFNISDIEIGITAKKGQDAFWKQQNNFSEQLSKKVFEKQPDLTENYVIKSIKHVNFQYLILELTWPS